MGRCPGRVRSPFIFYPIFFFPNDFGISPNSFRRGVRGSSTSLLFYSRSCKGRLQVPKPQTSRPKVSSTIISHVSFWGSPSLPCQTHLWLKYRFLHPIWFLGQESIFLTSSYGVKICSGLQNPDSPHSHSMWQWFANVRGLVKTDCLAPPQRFSSVDQGVQGLRLGISTGLQGMLLLLVPDHSLRSTVIIHLREDLFTCVPVHTGSGP